MKYKTQKGIDILTLRTRSMVKGLGEYYMLPDYKQESPGKKAW